MAASSMRDVGTIGGFRWHNNDIILSEKDIISTKQ